MRIAAFADVHGNAFAFQAVLSDAQQRGADLLLNLGDIFYGPIAPRVTYDLLMEYGVVSICGNQDRQIYEATPEERAANPTLQFVLDDLRQAPLGWLKKLPFDTQVTDEIYMCHGTPANDSIYLLEDVSTGSPHVRAENDIIELLADQSSEIVLCGHSHMPRTVALRTGQLVVNPGSVGLPAYTDEQPVVHGMENYCPHASYSMLEKRSGGWIIQHLKVVYDYHLAAKECVKRHRLDWAKYITTGRVGG